MNGTSSLITIKAWRRPKMLGVVLSNLAKCYGIEKYDIFISVDRFNGECLDNRFKFEIKKSNIEEESKSVLIQYANENIGCAGNTNICLEYAFVFHKVDYMIHLEDDSVPAIDFLKFMEWSYSFIKDRKDILCVCPFIRKIYQEKNNIDAKNEDIDKVVLRNFFDPGGGFAITKERYNDICDDGGLHGINGKHVGDKRTGKEWLDYCLKNGSKITPRGSWAWYLRKVFAYNKKMLFPIINRAQNIGNVDGRWNPNAGWHKTNIYNEKWSNSKEYQNVDLNKIIYRFIGDE